MIETRDGLEAGANNLKGKSPRLSQGYNNFAERHYLIVPTTSDLRFGAKVAVVYAIAGALIFKDNPVEAATIAAELGLLNGIGLNKVGFGEPITRGVRKVARRVRSAIGR